MRRTPPIFSVLIHSLLLVFLTSCGSFVHHRVKSGETLYSIGWKYDVDYKTLAEWNDIPPPYLIHEGQWIRVVSPSYDVEAAPPRQLAKSQLNDIERIKNRITKKSPARKIHSKPKTPNRQTQKNVEPVDEIDTSGFKWIWPTKGELVKKFSNQSQGKKGIDIAGKRGQQVVASAAGLVVYSGSGIIGLGNLVIIKHNKNFLSAYAHNDVLLVKEGERVQQGQHIANMGDTGTEQVLLHFEIRKNGKPVNPLRYIGRL